MYDTNLYYSTGDENTLRLTIKDIPLSVHNSIVIDELERKKYKVKSKVTYQGLRVDGQLTDCLTGDRIVYIQKPSQSVSRQMKFRIFRARVFHFGQTLTPDSNIVCSNCLKHGRHRAACTDEVVCKLCRRSGHLSFTLCL